MKSFHCTECGRLFSRKRNLPIHMDSVHKGKKPFTCERCGKFFTQKSNLKSHLKAVHENMKPFFCSECGKSFSRKPHLVTHLESVHMGKKPFACEVCCKTFTQKSNLRSHLKTIHATISRSSLVNVNLGAPTVPHIVTPKASLMATKQGRTGQRSLTVDERGQALYEDTQGPQIL